MRGVFGYVLSGEIERYKNDALGFYMEDITWFNLIFVTMFIHAESFISNLPEDNKTSEYNKLVYSLMMFVTRCLHFFFLLPLHTAKRNYRNISQKVWIFFGVMEVIGIIITLTFKHFRGITGATSLVEVSVFFGQYVYWWFCYRNQDEVEDE